MICCCIEVSFEVRNPVEWKLAMVGERKGRGERGEGAGGIEEGLVGGREGEED